MEEVSYFCFVSLLSQLLCITLALLSKIIFIPLFINPQGNYLKKSKVQPDLNKKEKKTCSMKIFAVFSTLFKPG